MRLAFWTVLGLICLLNVGCAAEKLTKKQQESLKQTSMTFARQKPPIFKVFTERNSLMPQGGILEALAVEAIKGSSTAPEEFGESVRSKEVLEDAAVQIQQAMMDTFQKQVRPITVKSRDEAYHENGFEHIREQSQSDMAFVINTTDWGLRHYGTDTSFHYLFYKASARLIDLKKLDVTWIASCKYEGEAPRMQRPSLDDFLADNGALIKTELNRAADACVKQLSEQLF